MKRIADRPWLPVLFAMVLLLLGTVLLTVYFFGRLEESRKWVLHTDEVMASARAALSAAQDAESGQRGYLLTGRLAYLEPYDQARRALPGQIETLQRLVADSAAQTERARKLETLIAERLSIIDRTVALARAGQGGAARDLVQSDRGRLLMDELRTLTATILEEEQRLFLDRLKATKAAERRILIAALVGAVLGLSAMVGGAILLFGGNQQLRRTERSLTAQTQLLQATLDNVRHGLVAFDMRGRLVAFNRQFFELTALPESLARTGTPLSAFRLAESGHPGTIFDDLPDALAKSADPDIFVEIRRAARVLEVYRNPMPHGGFLISVLNVTRRVESDLIIRQSQKMEAIGHLTGGVAHDFNNLLQVVSGHLDLLLRQAHGEEVKERLAQAIAGVQKGAQLTGQLLAFARRQPLEPRVINLARVVQNMTDLLRRSLGERVEVEAVTTGGLWNTMADPGQVENAILNLAINARDAMPEGGKLTIEVSNAFLDDAYARHHADVSPGQYVMLAVTDTGHGMTSEAMTRAFEPFYTTKPEGQGTGLGLSQVYGFVKQSGGHVKIYSEVGHGTTVKIYLPRSRQEETFAVDAPFPIEGGRETVLVVEDDAAVRNAAVDLISDLGYTVLKAENAEAAFAIILSGVKVDLLFTDVVMPGSLKTRELARRAQEILPGLAVLFTSGYTENAIIHDGRLDEGVLLISKPYRRDDLARKIRQALRKAGPSAAADMPAAQQPAEEGAPGAPPAAGGGNGTEAQAAPAPVPAQAEPGFGVLLVEDEFLIRMATADMLDELGYRVHEAGDAEEALALLRGGLKVDVLLTDINLPGMKGTELAFKARDIDPALRIVVATGYASANGTAGAGFPDGTMTLAKPFQIHQLRALLEGLAL